MENNNLLKYTLLNIFEILLCILGFLLFFIPFSVSKDLTVQGYMLPIYLFQNNISAGIYLNYTLFIFYFIPAILIFKCISLFLKKKLPFICLPDRILSIFLNFVSSFIGLFFIAAYFLAFAGSISFILNQPYLLFISAGSLFTGNIFYLFYLMKSIYKKNKLYAEYLDLKKKQTANNIKTDIKSKEIYSSIQKKMIISFLSLIIFILILFSILVLRDYKSTIFKAVEKSGSIIAEQSARIFKDNLNDSIEINQYLFQENKKNLKSEQLQFQSLTFYKKVTGQNIFLADNSTRKEMTGHQFPDEYLKFFENNLQSDYIHNNEKKSYAFIAPVSFVNDIYGFSVIEYNENVIYESYFKAQIRIIILIILFIYITLIMVYSIGQKIISPILFLQMNVRKISNTLSKMSQGKEKIAAAGLQFEDKVNTKDEIKALSREFSNMVNVVKGLIPYISASTFKQADKKEISSSTKNLSFLFTDIRGFTTICEGKKPQQVVEMLNRYLSLQAQIVLENKGDIDKFVGDEVMAVFEGPKKEYNACKAGLEILNAVRSESIERKKKKLPVIDIGFGINTGSVVFGSIGAHERMDFTSIGDTVNLAARLEGANKVYKTGILITENVYKKIKNNFFCREIDLLAVKGKNKPVRIYELLNLNKNVDKDLKNIKTNFEKGLALYRNQKWDEAVAIFEKNIQNSANPDETSKIFIERIELFRINKLVENWDGVFRLTHK